MTIEFKKQTEFSKLLNPARNFEEEVFPIEFRTDPLTGDVGAVYEYRQIKLEKPDFSSLIARSLQRDCPFCPEAIDKLTPRFPKELFPEGRIRVGDSVAFPNAMPYRTYSAITVINNQHFVSLSEFTEDTLISGFLASQIYLKRVAEYDPEAKYCLIIWNYMPPSASSQLHPHLQLFAGYFPLTHHKRLLEASQSYYIQNKTNYWADLVAEEKRLGERYLATIGDTVWLTSFVPRSWLLDVLVVFRKKESALTLSQADIESFCHGLKKVFAYMNDQNFSSFNLCLYSGILGENYFWTQARLIHRLSIPPLDTSDCGSLKLLVDVTTGMRYPERVCQELKSYFG